jgi:hypothetical protein
LRKRRDSMVAIGLPTGEKTQTGFWKVKLYERKKAIGVWNCDTKIEAPHFYRYETQDQFCYPIDMSTVKDAIRIGEGEE